MWGDAMVLSDNPDSSISIVYYSLMQEQQFLLLMIRWLVRISQLLIRWDNKREIIKKYTQFVMEPYQFHMEDTAHISKRFSKKMHSNTNSNTFHGRSPETWLNFVWNRWNK